MKITSVRTTRRWRPLLHSVPQEQARELLAKPVPRLFLFQAVVILVHARNRDGGDPVFEQLDDVLLTEYVARCLHDQLGPALSPVLPLKLIESRIEHAFANRIEENFTAGQDDAA